MAEKQLVKTLKVRVRDKHAKRLIQMSRSVNFVWNYINELSHRIITEKGYFPNYNELEKYTKGCNKELGLHSQTVQNIVKEYVLRRKQFKKNRLNWRVSDKTSPKYSLGWVPVNTGQASWKGCRVYHNGDYFKVWDSYGLDEYQFKTASFSQDNRGRWYFNVCVAIDPDKTYSKGQGSIGIDLGLSDTATTSEGDVLEAFRFYRNEEERITKLQRANKKIELKNAHAKVKNKRKDAYHKFTRWLVDNYGEIYVGDVNSSKLAKTNMAKSIYDASWYLLKTMLEYKCDYAGIVYREVDERYTTVTCSECFTRNKNFPKGLGGLRIREWTCDECGTTHERDINAARNILAVGHGRLEGGIPAL